MNRFGTGSLPDREMASDRPAKPLNHDDIERDLDRFLAKGGQIKRLESRHAGKPMAVHEHEEIPL